MIRKLRLVAAVALFLWPASAWAHAHLKRSEPAAGSKVASSPRLIRLWFSEQPELSMTSISLKDANGKEWVLTGPQRDPSDPLSLSARVSQSLPAGRYTVEWRTAASDGHPSHGTFGFVVLTEAAAPTKDSAQAGAVTNTLGAGSVAPTASANSDNREEADAASSLSSSLARAFSFAGLLTLIGAVAFRALVLPRARGIDADIRARMDSRTAVLGLVASMVVMIGALARLFLESQMMSAMPGMQTMSMADMALHTQWGLALRLELGAAVVALVSFAIAARRVRRAWQLAGLSAIVLALTPALAGHAAASPTLTSLMIVSDYLHVLGGATWLGSLLAVMVVGVPLCLMLDGVERWSSVASLVNSFSPVALASVTVVIASGLIASWVHLEHLSALWQTAYGQFLLLKLALVAITLMIGAYNFRQVQPKPMAERGVVRPRGSGMVELGFGFLILVATGFLTGISP